MSDQLQNQINILKIRVFDAEEQLKNQTLAIQNFLNEVANILEKDEITMQDVYDYIIKVNQKSEESKQVNPEELLGQDNE